MEMIFCVPLIKAMCSGLSRLECCFWLDRRLLCSIICSLQQLHRRVLQWPHTVIPIGTYSVSLRRPHCRLECYKDNGQGSFLGPTAATANRCRHVHGVSLTPTVAIWVHAAAMHPVPDRVKLSFVIFDIRALWRWVAQQVLHVHWTT